jgi:hypothetical protein
MAIDRQPAESAAAIKPRTCSLPEMQNKMANVAYHVLPATTLTVCVITMRNGYTVLGHSACADPANFNVALGEKYAYEAAVNQLWSLEGYLLREAMAAETA